MAKFQVTGPDGQKYEVTAPDDATEEQVIAYAQQNIGKQSAMGGSPNAFKEAGKSDPVRSVISTLQGPLMNFADEGLAAVQGGIDRVFKGIPFDTARQQWRDYYRGATEGFAQDNPVLAPVLQAGAGMATGVAGAARGLPTVTSVLAPTTAAGRIGTAALAGAGAGAPDGLRPRVGQADAHASPVRGSPAALDDPVALEAVDHPRRGRGRHPGELGDRPQRQRPAGALEAVEELELRERELARARRAHGGASADPPRGAQELVQRGVEGLEVGGGGGGGGRHGN